jgi:hypothetical protein
MTLRHVASDSPGRFFQPGRQQGGLFPLSTSSDAPKNHHNHHEHRGWENNHSQSLHPGGRFPKSVSGHRQADEHHNQKDKQKAGLARAIDFAEPPAPFVLALAKLLTHSIRQKLATVKHHPQDGAECGEKKTPSAMRSIKSLFTTQA